jgi:cytochrome c oxidase subunit IV
MAEHVVPKRVYILVFVALIVLTVLTTAMAYLDLGPFNTVVALAIAVCKASLVVLFFMHMKYSTGMTRIVLAAAVGWLAILLALTLGDFNTRHWLPTPQGWESSAAPPGYP